MTDQINTPGTEEPIPAMEGAANVTGDTQPVVEASRTAPAAVSPQIDSIKPAPSAPKPQVADTTSAVKESKPRLALSAFGFLSFIFGIGVFAWFFSMIQTPPMLQNLGIPLIALVGVIIALITIIFGHRSRQQIRKSPHNMKGKTLANIGLILGYFFLFFVALVILLAFLKILTITGWVIGK